MESLWLLRCTFVANIFKSILLGKSVILSELRQSVGNPLISLFANILPILNGRDTSGKIIYLGPQGTKIHRYLLLLFLAKSTTTFSLLSKRIDNSDYFTLYGLGKVAGYFKSVKPYYIAVNYDRTKVAKRIYEMLAKREYVDLKRMEGETYIMTTEEGDEICNQLLPELVTFAQLSNIAPTLMEAELSSDTYKVKKGVKRKILRDNANLKMVAEKLIQDILEINSPFMEDIKSLEEEPDI